MIKNDVVNQFYKKLHTKDPQHGYFLKGVDLAAKHITSLKSEEQRLIFNYINEELSAKGDQPIKELLIKVLQQVGDKNSLLLLDKIVAEGASIHGAFIVDDAKDAQKKLSRKKSD